VFRRQWERAVDLGFKTRYRAHVMRFHADPAFQRFLPRYPAFAEWWQVRTDITSYANWKSPTRARAKPAKLVLYFLFYFRSFQALHSGNAESLTLRAFYL
jgi:hypothetical protein